MGKKSVSTCWKNDIFYIQMKKFIFLIMNFTVWNKVRTNKLNSCLTYTDLFVKVLKWRYSCLCIAPPYSAVWQEVECTECECSLRSCAHHLCGLNTLTCNSARIGPSTKLHQLSWYLFIFQPTTRWKTRQ